MDVHEDRENGDNEYLGFLCALRTHDEVNSSVTIGDLAAVDNQHSVELVFSGSLGGVDSNEVHGIETTEFSLPHHEVSRTAEAASEEGSRTVEPFDQMLLEAQQASVSSEAIIDMSIEEAAIMHAETVTTHPTSVSYDTSAVPVPAKATPRLFPTSTPSTRYCGYYGKGGQEKCQRVAAGIDGRCGLHKMSQFCKAPQCTKFNQGNGYCIQHGGGKKCKIEGCEKHVQGYGLCSGHGGKPLCPVEGCTRKRMEGGFCKAHGGGRFCQAEGCEKRDIGGGRCITHGGGKKCGATDCTKVDRGGGFCKKHGGGKRCELEHCRAWAVGGGLCILHKGPGKRCKTPGCLKHDLGGGHCIAHGGGRKCIIEGCTKNRQVNKLCRGHGGKLHCCIQGCQRHAQSNRLCKAHGGGKKCGKEGCLNMQKGGGFCIRHGGGTKCKTPNCTAVDRGGGHCKAHGGGRKCNAEACKSWVIGGGFCRDHGHFMEDGDDDIMRQQQLFRRHEHEALVDPSRLSALDVAHHEQNTRIGIDYAAVLAANNAATAAARRSMALDVHGTPGSLADLLHPRVPFTDEMLRHEQEIERRQAHAREQQHNDEMARIASTVSYLSGDSMTL